MFDSSNSIISIAAAGILTGLAVWGILYGLLQFYGGSQARVKTRVKLFVSEQNVPEMDDTEVRERQRQTLFAELDSRWESRTLFRTLRDDLEAADLHITPTELLLTQIAVGIGSAVIVWTVIPLWGVCFTPFLFIAGLMMVRAYVRFLARRRIARFEEQLPNNLSILSSSVRGGFSLFQALQLITKEAVEPSKTEFTRVIQEISLGNPLGVALEGLAKRIPTEDVDILVTAITMQQQTGGNLTHVLEVVATTIRERHRVQRDIQALTAQQRFSAILLTALPFLMGLALFFISPSYIKNLFQPGWVLCMPIGAFIMSIIGFFVMRRLADIDV